MSINMTIEKLFKCMLYVRFENHVYLYLNKVTSWPIINTNYKNFGMSKIPDRHWATVL